MRISDWSSDVCSSDLDILEIGLEDRHDAALQVRNLGGILVDAPGLESQLGKASPRNKAYVPGTYDSYPHCLLHFTCTGSWISLVGGKGGGDRVEDASYQVAQRAEHGGQRLAAQGVGVEEARSEEHTAYLLSLMRISYAVVGL